MLWSNNQIINQRFLQTALFQNSKNANTFDFCEAKALPIHQPKCIKQQFQEKKKLATPKIKLRKRAAKQNEVLFVNKKESVNSDLLFEIGQ